MATNDSHAHDFDLEQVMLVIESEGKILVASEYAFHPKVCSQVQIIKTRGKDRFYQVVKTTMQDIEERAKVCDKDAVVAVRSQSDMEREATDLFQSAVSKDASDIHVRVSNNGRTQIFFRIHGDLELVAQHPGSWGQALCMAIYHSLSDVSDATYDESSRQDARIANKRVLPPQLDGIRIATTPMVDGSVMVLRLLYDNAAASDDLCELGFTREQSDQVQHLKKRPTGIIVISGPTGSGKSTTMQRSLKALIRETGGKKHVITVEDPPEYQIPGAVQTPVANASTEEERSAAFQIAIKGAMRIDPDIMMIGEMRDPPSAKLAITAAMTGHQVWSTLHANGSFHIVTRLINMGVDIGALTDSSILAGLLSQRLLKKLCKCKKPFLQGWDAYKESRQSPEEDFERIASVVDINRAYLRGDGCTNCGGTGISGRTVVAEVVVTDNKMMEYLRKLDMAGAAHYWRTELGGMSMVDHAVMKINQGEVDPFETEDKVGMLDEADLSKRTQTLRAVA